MSTVKELKERLSQLPDSYVIEKMALKVKNPKYSESILIEYDSSKS